MASFIRILGEDSWGKNYTDAYRESLTYDVNDFQIKDFEKVFYVGTERSPDGADL